MQVATSGSGIVSAFPVAFMVRSEMSGRIAMEITQEMRHMKCTTGLRSNTDGFRRGAGSKAGELTHRLPPMSIARSIKSSPGTPVAAHPPPNLSSSSSEHPTG